MPTKPLVPQLDWTPAADPSDVVEPSGSKKTQGWSPSEPLPAQNANWINYSLDVWIKYLEALTDALGNRLVVLGTSAQVTAGTADFDDPQDAYDEAADNGGGIVLILNGTIAGDLAVNQNAGIMLIGQGMDSILSGNVTITGNNNVLRDFQITGNLSITGGGVTENVVHVWHSALATFSMTSSLRRNDIHIRRGTDTFSSQTGPASAGHINTGATDLTYAHHGQVLGYDNNSSGPRTLNLFDAPEGFVFTVRDNSNSGGSWAANPLTIARNGSGNIGGLAQDFVCDADLGSKTFLRSGGNWLLL